MAFDMQLMHWPTLDAFASHLRGVPRPSWVKGLTNHNTYRPDETQWRGAISMESMRTHYIGNGWESGPHLYLAAAAPRRADTGIWQMTPLNHRGIHAGECNTDHIGIESVGDFDARPPTADQYTLLIAVNRLLLERWQMPPEAVNVHNECMTGRTCPGKYLTGTQIRADLRFAWPRPDPFAEWGPIGKPEGIATSFATPRAWLLNKKLGKCVTAERFTTTGRFSVTEFENGIITYLGKRDVTIVEMF